MVGCMGIGTSSKEAAVSSRWSGEPAGAAKSSALTTTDPSPSSLSVLLFTEPEFLFGGFGVPRGGPRRLPGPPKTQSWARFPHSTHGAGIPLQRRCRRRQNSHPFVMRVIGWRSPERCGAEFAPDGAIVLDAKCAYWWAGGEARPQKTPRPPRMIGATVAWF